jgi:hypothetical protein
MHDDKRILIVDDVGSNEQLQVMAAEGRSEARKAAVEVERRRFVEKRHRHAVPQGTEKEPPPALMGVTKLTETAAATRKSKVVARSKAMANQAKKLVAAGDVKGAEKIKRRLEKLARGLV